MNSRWLWFDYVPPTLELPAPLRRRARRRAWARFSPAAREKLMFLGALGPVVLGAALCLQLATRGRGSAVAVDLAIMLYSAGLLASWVLGAIVGARTYGRLLYGVLHELGCCEICMHCGYWLRGLPQQHPICPECGTQHAQSS